MITEVPISGLKPHPINSQIYGNTVDDDLMSSIKSKGVLTPLIITKDNIIISGHSRYYACLKLKMETIPAIESDITNPLDIEEAVIIANKQRDKTTEQKAREFEHLKKIEEVRAKERQLRTAENRNLVMENLPEQEKGTSRDLAASKLGMSGKTAEKALKVVKIADEIAKDDPAKAQDIKDTLNNVSVNAAYEKVRDTPKGIEATTGKVTQKSLMANVLHKNMMPDAMDKAYRDFEFEVQKAHDANWETVSKEAVSHFINKLKNIVDDSKDENLTCPICKHKNGTKIRDALGICRNTIDRLRAIMPDDPDRISAYEEMIEWCKSAIEDAEKSIKKRGKHKGKENGGLN